MGLIIGEVMHQGNTPLTFIENEVASLLVGGQQFSKTARTPDWIARIPLGSSTG